MNQRPHKKPSPLRTSPPRRKKTYRRESPLKRLLPAALAVVSIVLVSVGLTSLIRTPSDDALALLNITPTPVPTETPEPTPTPEPTVTPTPAVYAPFGAQYGHGGEYLIPETPTPDPQTLAAARSATPTPTAKATTTYRTLKKGSTGNDVRNLQQALINLGYLSGSADGEFGMNTQNAVVQFQAVNGLSTDGIAGTQTLTLLYSGNALSAAEAPEMDYLMLVNRSNRLDKGFVPTSLVKIEDVIPESVLKCKYTNMRANRTATEALYRMLQAAIDAGVSNWQVSSAYRSYAEQEAIIEDSVSDYKSRNPSWSRERCLSATYQTVAPAGASEHQTGLTFDITVPGVSFTGTTQQKWLHEHCHEYGFIVRYTEDKEDITGFLAESWHFRYVGVDAAKTMKNNNWCLEEYNQNMGL